MPVGQEIKEELVVIQNLSVQHLISKVSFRFHHQMCWNFIIAENYALIIQLFTKQRCQTKLSALLGLKIMVSEEAAK
jgi:hypothetical protein